MSQYKRRAIILWHYEDAVLPLGMSGLSIAQKLHSTFKNYGSIISIQAFGDSSLLEDHIIVGMTQGGIKFIDSKSTSKMKDVPGTLLLTELFLFAYDNPPPATIIIITGDADFANALNALKFRGYTIVLVSPINTPTQLPATSSKVFSWDSILHDHVKVKSKEISLLSSSSSKKAIHPFAKIESNDLPIQKPFEFFGDENHLNTTTDLLDICLGFVDQGMDKTLLSDVDEMMKVKYPKGFQEGFIKVLIERAIGFKWFAVEGSGETYTLLFNTSQMKKAWEDLQSN